MYKSYGRFEMSVGGHSPIWIELRCDGREPVRFTSEDITDLEAAVKEMRKQATEIAYQPGMKNHREKMLRGIG